MCASFLSMVNFSLSPATASSPMSSSGTPRHRHHGSQQQQQQYQNQQQFLEEELEWDVGQVRADLAAASRVLADRGLRQAAQWATDQWLGLDDDDDDELYEDGTTTLGNNSLNTKHSVAESSAAHRRYQLPLVAAEGHSRVSHAHILFQSGEYAHAAAVLSQPSISKGSSSSKFLLPLEDNSMPPPRIGLSPGALQMRAYALYLAGEGRRVQELEQQQLQQQKGAEAVPPTAPPSQASANNPTTTARNPYLRQLMAELGDAYAQLDAMGLYTYSVVLRAALRDQLVDSNSRKKLPHNPLQVLLQSILSFPLNQSAWSDLLDSLFDAGDPDGTPSPEAEAAIETGLQGLHSDWTYHWFCAQVHTRFQHYEQASLMYQRFLNLFPSSSSMQRAYADVLYHQRDYATSKLHWAALHRTMPYNLDGMDLYSNILYVQEDTVALASLAHTCTLVDKYRPETCLVIGNYYSSKQNRAKAIQYFQRALRLDPSLGSAWTLLGHEYVEWKQTSLACQAYRQALRHCPQDYRAWYGLGQLYEFLNMSLYSLYYFKQACRYRPYDGRMWTAVGTTLSTLGHVSAAIQALEQATSLDDDADPVAILKLASLYEANQRTEDAAQCYMRHLQGRYQLVQEEQQSPFGDANNTPVSLETLLQGIAVETPEAQAILYLSTYHKNHGELETAGILASRLLEFAGPEKEQAKALLRELKSRSRVAAPTSSSSDIVFSP